MHASRVPENFLNPRSQGNRAQKLLAIILIAISAGFVWATGQYGSRNDRGEPRAHPRLASSVRADHRPKCLLGQNLQQQGVRHAPVDDMNRIDAAFGGIQCAFDFGQHAA